MRKITFLLVTLLVSAMSLAQQMKVQEVSRMATRTTANYTTDFDINHTQPTHSGARQIVYRGEQEEVDYSKGTFIVNEDWYGHQNSTVNFLTDEGEWIYRVVQKENPGIELGCTNQFGAIYGDRFYLIAKQEKDPGSEITGARITICDAKTMKVLKQIPFIYTDENGKSKADGRSFLGVDEHKGYVSTSNGIFILDLDTMGIRGGIVGTDNEGQTGYGELYLGQVGSMVRVNDRVFAVHQKKGLLVIDSDSDKVVRTIEGPDSWGFGSVVLSKDGNLWLSIANKNGNGQADNRLMKLNPATLETEIIELPDGIYGPANSWYAWTPDCFSASTQQNVLYWNGGNSSWFSGKQIFKYDIDKKESSLFIDYSNDPDGWQIYGCSFRLHPVGDEAYVSLFKNFGDQTYILRKYDNEGKQVAEYPMISNYWFPSLPVFPDNHAPEVATLDKQEISEKTTIDLSTLATDADNMAAAIVKTIKSISDETILTAEMENGNLVITPLKNGSSDITIKVNSNGKIAETVVSVEICATSINIAETDNNDAAESYTIDGKRVTGNYRGLIIVKTKSGKVIKTIKK